MELNSTWSEIFADYYRNYAENPNILRCFLKALNGGCRGFAFTFWFRLSKRGGGLGFLYRLMYKHVSSKYCMDIPLGVEIGKGLVITHAMCIVINGNTKIGENVSLSQFLNIGSNFNTPAVIGDNVYIGPYVCLVENVEIGNNATIGAGAVVTKNIPENATAAGVPAKVINYNNPGRFIHNLEYEY